jgi:hypothetical protein
MDATKALIETQVANALLDVGVSMPLKSFHIPFRKEPVKLRVTVKHPCLGSKMRIDRLYLGMGITLAKYKRYTKEQRMLFRATHGGAMTRIIALGICRGPVSGALFSGLVAWLVRWCVEDIYLEAIFAKFVELLGTQSFETTIASLEATLMTGPMNASQTRRKRS